MAKSQPIEKRVQNLRVFKLSPLNNSSKRFQITFALTGIQKGEPNEEILFSSPRVAKTLAAFKSETHCREHVASPPYSCGSHARRRGGDVTPTSRNSLLLRQQLRKRPLLSTLPFRKAWLRYIGGMARKLSEIKGRTNMGISKETKARFGMSFPREGVIRALCPDVVSKGPTQTATRYNVQYNSAYCGLSLSAFLRLRPSPPRSSPGY